MLLAHTHMYGIPSPLLVLAVLMCTYMRVYIRTYMPTSFGAWGIALKPPLRAGRWFHSLHVYVMWSAIVVMLMKHELMYCCTHC